MTATSFSPRWQRFVALGDSTTEGLEDGDDDSGYVGFADRLARYIADAQREPLLYANLGVRGRKAAEVHAEQLPAALELSPDLATVVVGINDVLRLNSDLQRTGRYIAAMFSALRASGATVATFTFPDLSAVMPVARLLRPRLRQLNNLILDAAREHDVVVADLRYHPFSADLSYWHDDRLHGSPRGHDVVAATLAARLGLRPDPVFIPDAVARRSAGAELRWAQQHLVRYLARHARGRKLGHGRRPKRPQLLPVVPPPTGSDQPIHPTLNQNRPMSEDAM